MTRRRLLALIAAVFAAGCATLRGPLGPDDRTGGVTVEMLSERPGNAVSRVRLERDGTVRFGGGLDARNERFTWTGAATDDELRAVRDVLAATDWLEDTFPPAPPDADTGAGRMTVFLRTPAGARRIRSANDEPRIAALHEILATAAARRHEEFLGTFPEPEPPDS